MRACRYPLASEGALQGAGQPHGLAVAEGLRACLLTRRAGWQDLLGQGTVRVESRDLAASPRLSRLHHGPHAERRA